jgi:hypothetical protein
MDDDMSLQEAIDLLNMINNDHMRPEIMQCILSIRNVF